MTNITRYARLFAKKYMRTRNTHHFSSTRKLNTTKSITEQKGKVFPRRIFSGIQPTGGVHLGNYLGAISQWVNLQNESEDVTYSIVNLHSITLPQNPEELSENILKMTATLLACGIDPAKATLFQQSDVQEHTELFWNLTPLSTMARLAHLPQFKEKSVSLKEIPLGLFSYPVLQAADILLHKATHIPVGDDQLQHLQLCQELANRFNKKYGRIFPTPHAIILESGISRIKSLKDPQKKMSKSDPDPESRISLTDTNDEIVEKIKKSFVESNSKVTFDPDDQPGISNLITMHSIVSGKSIEDICKEAEGMDISKYKYVVAENIIEHISPIRQKITKFITEPQYLLNVLKDGANKASEIAEKTTEEVMKRLGLTVDHRYIQQDQYFKVETESLSSQKIYSGIKPTGSVHLGNYLGAISQWVKLQHSKDNITMYNIADLHAMALPQNPKQLSKNILETTAILLACGINPDKTILFRQSQVKQHSELCWYLGCISTMEKLANLRQFQEKSASLKEVPLSLLIYPILQAADILTYKSTHVPIGDDQLDHLEFCKNLANLFNEKYGLTFPIPHPIILDSGVSTIRSLRDPSRKMSKSDPDPKSYIFLTDSNEDIIKKTKKSVTDFNSKITYDPKERPGVSNLIDIHSALSGKSIEDICKEAEGMDTLRYKFLIAENIIEHISPIRQKTLQFIAEPQYLINVLQEGANKASEMAEITTQEVRYKLGYVNVNVNKESISKVLN